MSADDLVERIARVRAYDHDVEHIWQPAARRRGTDAQAVLDRGLARPVRLCVLWAVISAAVLGSGVYLSVNPGADGLRGDTPELLLAFGSSFFIVAAIVAADVVRTWRKAPGVIAQSVRDVAKYDAIRKDYADGIDYLHRALVRKDLGPVLGLLYRPRKRQR